MKEMETFRATDIEKKLRVLVCELSLGKFPRSNRFQYVVVGHKKKRIVC